MSIPYQFNTEQFNNVPCGTNLGWLYPSTSVNSYQYTQKQGNNSVYFYKSSMDAYYAKQNSNNLGLPTPVVQFKSQQERIAALLGSLSVKCGRF
jgi:hypothetical protein